MTLVDPEVVTRLPGTACLAPFTAAGVFDAYEVHLVANMTRRHPSLGDEVALALALAARAPRFGHVCTGLDPDDLPQTDGEDAGSAPPAGAAFPLPWPDSDRWERALRDSPLVAGPQDGARLPLRPLVWDGGRLYLQRLWWDECQVARELARRARDAAHRIEGIDGIGGTGGIAGIGGIPGGARWAPNESADRRFASLSAEVVESVLGRLFGPSDATTAATSGDGHDDLQRLSARRGLLHRLSIVAGGPGTGKTYTVARLLAAAMLLLEQSGRRPAVALAAPTGKAANRMTEAVAASVAELTGTGVVDEMLATEMVSVPAVTLHRLLGARGDGTFRYDRRHPLPHDLVVVDETSMVSLPLLADLLVALRPEARLVLVGDPSQLTSIEAGTVMSDLVGPYVRGRPRRGSRPHEEGSLPPLAGRVTVLDRVHRYSADSGIAELAGAVRVGDARATMEVLRSGAPDLRWVPTGDTDGLELVRDELVSEGTAMVAAAAAGDAAAALELSRRMKVLCALRRGPMGRSAWSDLVRSAVLERRTLPDRRRWYAGRPIMVTANDPGNRLSNGDVGVAVEQAGRVQVAVPDGRGLRLLSTTALDRYEEWWAMTIHKAQGSEFDHAVVVLPGPGSPILTRELLYTGVTRARSRLTLVGDEETITTAVNRPVARASGLSARLWASPAEGA